MSISSRFSSFIEFVLFLSVFIDRSELSLNYMYFNLCVCVLIAWVYEYHRPTGSIKEKDIKFSGTEL